MSTVIVYCFVFLMLFGEFELDSFLEICHVCEGIVRLSDVGPPLRHSLKEAAPGRLVLPA